jgi:hypothetical protein
VEFVSLIESRSTRSWRATRPREKTLASSPSERSKAGLFLQVEQNDYGSESCVFESRRVHALDVNDLRDILWVVLIVAWQLLNGQKTIYQPVFSQLLAQELFHEGRQTADTSYEIQGLDL